MLAEFRIFQIMDLVGGGVLAPWGKEVFPVGLKKLISLESKVSPRQAEFQRACSEVGRTIIM